MKHRYAQGIVTGALILLLAGIPGCKPEIIAPQLSLGVLNTRQYKAFGDGYTAGFANTLPQPFSAAGLYESAQSQAYPVLLARQFQQIRRSEFNLPLAGAAGSGRLHLRKLWPPACTLIGPRLGTEAVAPEAGWLTPPGGELHNLGLPYLEAGRLSPDSSHISAVFFRRTFPDQPDYPAAAAAAAPEFFTLWLGTQDLLAYGVSGGDPAYLPPDPDAYGQEMDRLLRSILREKPQTVRGLIGQVPDIVSFPYFSELRPVYRDPENCDAPPLPLYVQSPDGYVRFATEADHLLLPLRGSLGQPNGLPEGLGLHPENPIPHTWVLDGEESARMQSLALAYNGKLDSLVSALDAELGGGRLAAVGLHALFSSLAGGVTVDGIGISSSYLDGGIFCLDGIYLTPRGQALVANAFIERINGLPSFKAQVSPLNIADFPGVIFP